MSLITSCLTLALCTPPALQWNATLAAPSAAAHVAVTSSEDGSYLIKLTVTLGHRTRSQPLRMSDGPILSEPSFRVLRSRSPGLIQLDYRVRDWATSVFFVAGKSRSAPLVFKYRSNPTDVIKQIWSSNGLLIGIETYDKWIGGAPRPITIGDQRLDRREVVTRYRVSETGLICGKVVNRVIPNLGGGVRETKFHITED